MAKQEGISLNQHIVFALTRQATLAHAVQMASDEELARQQALFDVLLQSLLQASLDEIEAVLAEREPVEPEPGLMPERVALLRERLAEYRVSDKGKAQNE